MEKMVVHATKEGRERGLGNDDGRYVKGRSALFTG